MVPKLRACCWDMQKFRAKWAVLVVVFKVKVVVLIVTEKVLSLFFTCNFTLNTTKIFLNSISNHIAIIMKNESHGWRVSCIWKADLLGALDVEFYSIKDLQWSQHNNDEQQWQHKNIMNVMLLSLLLIFELIPTGCFSEFHDVLNLWGSQKSRFEYFEKETDYLFPRGLLLP